jgi:hypothetical protein
MVTHLLTRRLKMSDYEFLDKIMILVNSNNIIDNETIEILPDYLNDKEIAALKQFIKKCNKNLNKE